MNRVMKVCSHNAQLASGIAEMTALGLASMWKSHAAKRLTLT